MALELLHPAYAALPCDTCEKYLHVGGVLTRRGGQPVPRPKNVPTPCSTCPKIPADAPSRSRRHAQEMSPRNAQAYWHYRRCAAVGRFPEDAIVEHNAATIKGVEDAVRDGKSDRLSALLSALVSDAARSHR